MPVRRTRNQIPPEVQGFVERVREVRQENGWTMKRLAERCGVTRQAVTRWFGKSPVLPGGTTLRAFSLSTRYSVDWLLTGEGLKRLGMRQQEGDLALNLSGHVESVLQAEAPAALATGRDGRGQPVRFLPSPSEMLTIAIQGVKAKALALRGDFIAQRRREALDWIAREEEREDAPHPEERAEFLLQTRRKIESAPEEHLLRGMGWGIGGNLEWTQFGSLPDLVEIALKDQSRSQHRVRLEHAFAADGTLPIRVRVASCGGGGDYEPSRAHPDMCCSVIRGEEWDNPLAEVKLREAEEEPGLYVGAFAARTVARLTRHQSLKLHLSGEGFSHIYRDVTLYPRGDSRPAKRRR